MGKEAEDKKGLNFSEVFFIFCLCAAVSVLSSFLCTRWLIPQRHMYVFDLKKAVRELSKKNPSELKTKMVQIEQLLNTYDGPVFVKGAVINDKCTEITDEVLKAVALPYKSSRGGRRKN